VELEPVYIPIRKVDNVRHAYLGLEGTILLFDQRQAAVDSEFLIPVELVSVSAGLRFESRRLIAAVLCLFGPVLLGIAAILLLFGSLSIRTSNSTAVGVLALVLFGMPLAGLVAFLILFVRFFFRVKTVRLDIRPEGSGSDQPAGMTIEFYKRRRQEAEIDNFIEQIRARQGLVGESLMAPVHRPAGFQKEHSIIPRLAALLYLASLPALVTGRLPLLLLPVAVLAWFAYRQVQFERQPREYRQALRHYLRGDYEETIDVLERLRRRLPEYLPTYFCLAEACVRGGRFEEAFQVASCLASDYPDVARRMEADIWLFKRIDQRRHGAA
jgi:hypothetical protein